MKFILKEDDLKEKWYDAINDIYIPGRIIIEILSNILQYKHLYLTIEGYLFVDNTKISLSKININNFPLYSLNSLKNNNLLSYTINENRTELEIF